MAKTSLILNSTDQTGKTLQKTVTDVNPYAAGEALLNFSKKLNNLTSNTYNSTYRVDKANLDTESVSTKSIPTLQIDADNITSGSGRLNVPVIYNGDGEIYMKVTSTNEIYARYYGNAVVLSGTGVAGTEIKLYSLETENYLAASCSHVVS